MFCHAEGVRPSDALVLLEYVSVTSNGTNGWQHLLFQHNVAIITAISLSARIDEHEACASGLCIMTKIGHQFFVHPRVTLPVRPFELHQMLHQVVYKQYVGKVS